METTAATTQDTLQCT